MTLPEITHALNDLRKTYADIPRTLTFPQWMTSQLLELMGDRDRFHTEVKRLKNEILKAADQEDSINDTAHADASEITSLRRDLNEYTTLYREYKDRYEFTLGRANALEEWLTEYRDDLKKENVFHKNEGVINAINELLYGDENI